MYISKLHIENIRCFKKATIDFLPEGNKSQLIPWTIILGNNGTGKSTILQCIALGLCGETSASGLLRELDGEIIRSGESSATIQLELVENINSYDTPIVITTSIHKSPSGEEELNQVNNAIPYSKIFACGYGSSRTNVGDPPAEKYSILESVYTLFNKHASLRSPETALYRIIRKGVDEKKLLNRIDNILDLPESSTKLGDTGVKISGPWGNYTSMGSVGDGYVAMIALAADLLNWQMLNQKENFKDDINGILLIDEIEQHLHPKWQKRVIPLLSDEFNKYQIITTTHSPLVVIGAADLTSRYCQLTLCEQNNDEVIIQDGIQPPSDYRADQVLTSFLFGLDSTTSSKVSSSIERYVELRQIKDPDLQTKNEIANLNSYLSSVIGTPETELQNKIDDVISNFMQKQVVNKLRALKNNPEYFNDEVRNEIYKLLK